MSQTGDNTLRAGDTDLHMGPNHWDLYILVGGIALGLLLSPWVLGRVSPVRHDRLFYGGVQQTAERDAFVDDTKAIIQQMHVTGADAAAISEKVDERREAFESLDKAMNDAIERHATVLNIIAMALLGLVVLVTIAETLVDHRVSLRTVAIRRWLGRGRTIALSLWLVLMIGRMNWW